LNQTEPEYLNNPLRSMRYWDNFLLIRDEYGISQSDLEFAVKGSFTRR